MSIVMLAAAQAPDTGSLVLVLGASSLGALLSKLHHRVVLPTVVLEIVLGIAIGPEVLDWAEADSYIDLLANFGLVLLFFFAGLEVIEKNVPTLLLVRGGMGWGVSLALGLVAGFVLHGAGLDAEWWLLGIALSTTALGTLVPILADTGLLTTPLGRAVLGTGVAGECWPIVVISVFLTGVYGAAAEVILLLAFGAVVAAAAAAAVRARPPRVVRVLPETVHTTGQTAVRLSLFLLAALVLLANDVGFDFVLGAFAAGLVVGLALDSPEGRAVRMRLEGIGFGFLIPIYFVVTGMNFDLDSLLTPGGPRSGGAVPGAAAPRPRGVRRALAPRAGTAADAQPRRLRRDRAAADRGDRRDRRGSWRDRDGRGHVAGGRRDDLRAGVPAGRARARWPAGAGGAGRGRRRRALDA
ncbi:MAG TPA: cation:proton antiporter [Gaiellaceae bacterium]|nr:cation:proton antiporter [Gaiellaceae bacterium]